NHPFILMGDFNAGPGSREIKNLVQSGMVDLFHAANPDSSGFTWNPRTNLNIRTYYLENAGLSKHQSLLAELKKIHKATPKRIDFIFLGPSTLVESGQLKVTSSRVAMDEVMNGVHASDHYGVFAKIEFNE
ncbi:MAG: endonuclease/exonuclease/phosphatase family protein, partial [bacterium]